MTTQRQKHLAAAARDRCLARAEAAFLAGDTDAGHGHLELARAHGSIATANPSSFRSAGVRSAR